MGEIQANKYFLFRDSKNLSNRGSEIHYHSCFEIYCLTDGECDSFVDDKLYNLHPGDMIIIPPGAIHATHYNGKKHSRVLINFSMHYISSSLIDVVSKGVYFFKNEGAEEELNRMFAEIAKEESCSDSFSEEAIRSLLARLIIMAVRHEPRQAEKISSSSFIEDAVRYVQNNYRNPICLDDIAKSCGVSKVHLSRRFKEKIGIGLNEYIAIYRLKNAKELLLTQDKMSICEVAFECGFNDSNYFSWLFKKTYGVTPSQYRKNTRM